jgi:hypothetical protein
LLIIDAGLRFHAMTPLLISLIISPLRLLRPYDMPFAASPHYLRHYLPHYSCHFIDYYIIFAAIFILRRLPLMIFGFRDAERVPAQARVRAFTPLVRCRCRVFRRDAAAAPIADTGFSPLPPFRHFGQMPLRFSLLLRFSRRFRRRNRRRFITPDDFPPFLISIFDFSLLRHYFRFIFTPLIRRRRYAAAASAPCHRCR